MNNGLGTPPRRDRNDRDRSIVVVDAGATLVAADSIGIVHLEKSGHLNVFKKPGDLCRRHMQQRRTALFDKILTGEHGDGVGEKDHLVDSATALTGAALQRDDRVLRYRRRGIGLRQGAATD